jgi:hypothetical protein
MSAIGSAYDIPQAVSKWRPREQNMTKEMHERYGHTPEKPSTTDVHHQEIDIMDASRSLQSIGVRRGPCARRLVTLSNLNLSGGEAS